MVVVSVCFPPHTRPLAACILPSMRLNELAIGVHRASARLQSRRRWLAGWRGVGMQSLLKPAKVPYVQAF